MSTSVGRPEAAAFSMQALLNPSQEYFTQPNELKPTTNVVGRISPPQKPENRASSDRKRRHERAKARYNEEMAHLSEKCKELEDQLHSLENTKKMKIEGHSQSPWEGFARRQAWKRQQAMIENTKLKTRLENQLSIIKDLQGVLTKQPQLFESILGPNDMISVRLTSDPVHRKIAVENMIQTQLSRMEEVFVENGLLQSHESWKQVVVRFDEQSRELVFEKSMSLIFNVPISALANGLHTTVNCRPEHSEYANGSSDLIEMMDVNTHYTHRVYTLDGAPNVHVNFLHHTYSTADSFVWIGQSVLEDELHPIPHDVFRSRESIWCVAEPISATQSRVKKVRRIHLIPPTARELGDCCPVGALADILINCYSINMDLFAKLLEESVLKVCPRKPAILMETTGPLIQLNPLRDSDSYMSTPSP